MNVAKGQGGEKMNIQEFRTKMAVAFDTSPALVVLALSLDAAHYMSSRRLVATIVLHGHRTYYVFRNDPPLRKFQGGEHV